MSPASEPLILDTPDYRAIRNIVRDRAADLLTRRELFDKEGGFAIPIEDVYEASVFYVSGALRTDPDPEDSASVGLCLLGFWMEWPW
jgi:hypothetical protein